MLEEWHDSPETNRTLSAALIGILLILVWASVVLNQPALEEQAGWAEKFAIMLLVVAAFGLIDQLKENNSLGVSFAGFGESNQKFTMAMLLGAGAGFLLVSSSMSISSFAVVSGVLVSQMFVVLASPVVEELFFRGLVFFTLREQLRNDWMAAIMASLIFGGFHLLAYGGDITMLGSSILFSLVCIFGNSYFKTLGFGIGVHLANNALLSAGLA